jgi:hypothetical protein
LEFKNIILEEKLYNKYKNGHEKFSGERVFLVLGALPRMSKNHEVQRLREKPCVGEAFRF